MIKLGHAGQHIWTITPSQMTTLLKLVFALQILCPLSTSLIKLAILIFFRRLFGFQSKKHRIVIYITFAIISLLAIIQLIIPLINCSPISKNWDFTVPGKCRFDNMGLWRYLSVPNVVTSFLMLAIPAPAVWRLRVGVYTRVGLAITGVVCLL